ncbi:MULTISPECIES: lipoprotein-releasing ABC transporter permease subunit [unclassified Wenzhouxiangella]|uniref:lipoprotein-releasing ABC transporter permease subunit n=1 Tax=unclassified Wenzhouxiangella TaxID=2613841 RepID=UPI000E328BC1|nr:MULTISPECIES: lipoprotein-releasing ABC transporter permease subunit [unclassified Wenzhouxiangella]RFF28240.1 lipoprotein-releasing ABC transporter permease subunit [Wenzhouxiangella sp. 15181]RFP67915.1 lipoprotein-releasing ABC transporter permease subunit [Wenzhouxiangella sp. 15190]
MYQPLSIFVGLRYLRAKRRNHFISFISLVSMGGIALGVMVLITVLSVMNGFEQELRERILGMISHATIEGAERRLSDWESLLEQVQAHPSVVGAAPYVEQETLIKGRGTAGAQVRGIDPGLEPMVSDIGELMRHEDLDALVPGEWRVILGGGLAARLGVREGDSVTIFAPEIRATPAGVVPQVRRFEVAGIFEAGVQQYDTALAVIHFRDAQRLFRLSEQVSGIRLKFDDMMQARSIAWELSDQLGGAHSVRDWTQQHANFFRAVRTEKTVMFIILSLIIAVAAFNIISTLVMVVTDKQADIAILKTMGLGPRKIMAIFMVQGSLIGVIGTLLGIVAGVALALNVEQLVAWLEQFLSTDFLSAEVYYISDLPSELRWADVIKFGSVALVLSLLSTIYPAWRAARTEPVEALRHE